MYGNAIIDLSIYKWVWSVWKNELRDRDAAAASAYLRGKLLLQEGMRGIILIGSKAKQGRPAASLFSWIAI